MIASALLIMLLSIGISSNADAAWRGCYGRGWGHPVVRVCAPVPAVRIATPVVAVGGYYGGYYARPCAPRYYAHGYYGGYRRCR